MAWDGIEPPTRGFSEGLTTGDRLWPEVDSDHPTHGDLLSSVPQQEGPQQPSRAPFRRTLASGVVASALDGMLPLAGGFGKPAYGLPSGALEELQGRPLKERLTAGLPKRYILIYIRR